VGGGEEEARRVTTGGDPRRAVASELPERRPPPASTPLPPLTPSLLRCPGLQSASVHPPSRRRPPPSLQFGRHTASSAPRHSCPTRLAQRQRRGRRRRGRGEHRRPSTSLFSPWSACEVEAPTASSLSTDLHVRRSREPAVEGRRPRLAPVAAPLPRPPRELVVVLLPTGARRHPLHLWCG
jgi:hypothetical protein